MDKYNTIQMFTEQYIDDKKISKELGKLMMFTAHSKFDRDIASRIHLSKNILNDKNKDYIFNYNEKSYPFSVFSDRDLQKYDKKILGSSKRLNEGLYGTLKLACSMDLVNSRVAIGNSKAGILYLLILHEENGIDKVIDYARNLEMSKDDYYELFHFDEINVIDKYELYNIYRVLTILNNFDDIYYYLIFTKEIFNDLARNNEFNFLTEKYDKSGFNRHNYLLFGKDCDSIFFRKEDAVNKNGSIIREIDSFTENPTKKSRHISKSKEKGRYIFKHWKIGKFKFRLLSDKIVNQEIKNILLSSDRYGECHENSNKLIRSLTDRDTQSAYVVGGKIKVNEIDYFLHSWIEIDEKNIVVDFNHNIVMNRDKYYKLYGAVAITKTKAIDMKEIVKKVIFEADFFTLHPMDINYFGYEFMNDVMKNEKLLKKKD